MTESNLEAIKPINIPNKLAPTPDKRPLYSKKIKNLKGQEVELADPMATRALLAIMNQFAVNGGAACHWGGPSAFAEIMSSIHGIMFSKSEWYKHFNFINDAGHTENGIYALRAILGFDNLTVEDLFKFRSIESKLTGHGEAHLNPEGVYISNGPLGSGLPQAQGLCLADNVIKNNRVTICTISDGGSMEGEAKESFSAIPGLAHKNKMNPFVLVVSDNNTKLSGRIDKDSFSMEPTFDSLATLGWEVITEAKGHDLEVVHQTMERAIEMASKNPNKPVAIIFKTVKGQGIKSTEESSSGGHGFPLKAFKDDIISFVQEIYNQKAPAEMINWAKSTLEKPKASENKPKSTTPTEKVQPGFSRAMSRAAKEGIPVYSISSDLQGSTGVADFQKAFPNHYIDLGIAEANMVSAAIGFSKQGLIPVVDTFAQFGITKGNLPLIMAGLSQAPVIALFSHAGFQDAADGASHQATTYLAAVSSIPHVTVIQVACSKEAEEYMYKAIKNMQRDKEAGRVSNSVVFFYGRENHPASYSNNLDYTLGKAQVLAEGTDATIVTSGSLLDKALNAKEILSKSGISLTVINNCFINQIDIETIKNALSKTKGRLVTLEDHQLIGGMGSQLVHTLKMNNIDFSVKCLANKGKFGQSAYLADDLYDLHGLSENGIIEAVKELL